MLTAALIHVLFNLASINISNFLKRDSKQGVCQGGWGQSQQRSWIWTEGSMCILSPSLMQRRWRKWWIYWWKRLV